MKKLLTPCTPWLAAALLLAASAARAQTPVGVGIGTALPNGSAALDVSCQLGVPAL